MNSNSTTPRSLPVGVLKAGDGLKCKKWKVRLVQKTDKKGKYSPKGDEKGMSGITYEIMVAGTLEKGSLDGKGKSAILPTAAPASGEAIDVKFGLKILPDYAKFDKDIFGKSTTEIDVDYKDVPKLAKYADKCAIRMSIALNSAVDGKYIIPRSHKVKAKKERTISVRSDHVFLSSLEVVALLNSHYPHTPYKYTGKEKIDKNLLDYKKTYAEYAEMPKACYWIKASFGITQGATSAASGHVDILEGAGLTTHLTDYSSPEYNPTEFHLWIFTEVVFLRQEQEDDTCIFVFEHKHVK